MVRAVCILPILLLAACVSPAFACSCKASGPACQAYWKTDAVFDATVTDIQPLTPPVTGSFISDSLVTMHVRRSWKGASDGTLQVATSANEASCGYPFKKGARYLVFARKSSDARLQVSLCSATTEFEGTGPAAEFLSGLSAPATGGRIFGSVGTTVRRFETEAHTSESPTVTAVHVRGVGVEQSTQSAGGTYEFRGLPAGSYTVSITTPDGYVTSMPDRQADLADPHGCAEEDFGFSPAGALTGRLVGPDGRGVARMRVEVTSPDMRPHPVYGYESTSTYSDNDGYFTVGGLAPGRYVVGIDLQDLPNDSNPYARTLYPDGANADVLTLSLGQSIDLGTWRLPPPLEVVTLPGVVTWNDGSPAAGVTVFLQDHTGNPRDLARGAGLATSDTNGRFVVRVRRTRAYTFQVRDSRPPRPSFEISASSVTIGSGAPEPLRIVIRLPPPQ